ncbi:drug/metabolite transporter (DMT)-like permease [Variovorax boronicumulans]|uniref:DMT family transporter n=1 Tax=Variovorax boronicumulans TaxID=436515 RepID=UPI0024753471|nr:DMT family transporter [Variovorax boronicumulans]MDH6166602.1 drug/metabolite transporter (DMT)-like permease [Variovorax boronicumulans]
MPLSAFALILLAGVIHASWNIAAKKANGDARFAFQSGVFMAVVWAPVGITLGWSVVPTWGAKEWGFIALSGVLHVFYYVVLLRGYRKSDLTVVYPLARGSGPLLSSLVAILFLGEKISLVGVAGIFGVVLGVFLVAGGPRLFHKKHDPVQRERVQKGIRYGVLTGAFIAAYTVTDSYAVKFLAMSPILLDYMSNFVRLVLLLPAALHDRATTARMWRAQWKYALLVAAISPVSYVLVLYAVQQAPISHVAPAREVSMLFAALIGGHLLREGDRMLRLLGALFIAAGVVALALG